ncbi:MAG: hypothetical protein EPN30_01920 [Actinomycetota bacterium]|nr:MAG: hypothetical protein EPN30_01920 [Actinomycetota bacterium]
MAVGILGLVGGAEWNDGCSFDAYLIERSGSKEVTILPTAAAYERPDLAVEHATKWFSTFGVKVKAAMVITRHDAEDPGFALQLAESPFIYLGGGSPLHLFSVLKDSHCYQAMVSAFHKGAVLAGSSAGAMVLGDPMVDPRGGGLTLGLGLVKDLAVMPHYTTTSAELKHRTQSLAEPEVVIAGIDEQTALIRESDGSWTSMGQGSVHLISNGAEIDISVLPERIQLDT